MFQSIISALSAPVTEWLKSRREVKEAKHRRDLAVINNQARLAADAQSHNHDWEMASLNDKDKALRWFSFLLFTTPVLIVVIDPEQGTAIFERLNLVPDWMLQIWFYMIAGVWGIASLKNAVPQIVAGFRKGK